jgi:hypothetical protein
MAPPHWEAAPDSQRSRKYKVQKQNDHRDERWTFPIKYFRFFGADERT